MRTFRTWRRRMQAAALATLGITLVAASGAAARQEPDAPGGITRGMSMRMPLRHLDLSAEQQASIREIFETHRAANEAMREELFQARQSLRAAVFGSTAADTATIEQLIEKVAELETKVLRSRVAAEAEMAAVLTEGQRQKMATARPVFFHERIGPPAGR